MTAAEILRHFIEQFYPCQFVLSFFEGLETLKLASQRFGAASAAVQDRQI